MLHSFWAASSNHAAGMASTEAASAQRQARQAQQSSADVEERLEKLQLISMALWELLRDRTKLTENDLIAKVQEIDLRDGTLDGKVTRTVCDCPNCGRRMSPRHKKCIYCGHASLVESAFDGV